MPTATFPESLTTTLRGEKIEVDFSYTKEELQTRWEPGACAEWEAGEIRWKGQAVCVRCHMRIIEEIYESFLEEIEEHYSALDDYWAEGKR